MSCFISHDRLLKDIAAIVYVFVWSVSLAAQSKPPARYTKNHPSPRYSLFRWCFVVVGDIKDVATISFTEQMQDNEAIIEGRATYAGTREVIKNRPKLFDLVVRDSKDSNVPGTYVSQPLKDAIERNGGKIYEII